MTKKKLIIRKKRIVFIALAAIVLILAIVVQRGFWRAFFPDKLDISFASDVSILDNGDFLVIDNGNKRVVKGNIDGSYSLIIQSSGRSFSNAAGAALDEAGNIYINDLSWSINGMDVLSERILRFNKAGILQEVLWEHDYVSMGLKPQKQQLFGPFYAEGSCFALDTTADGFTLLDLTAGTPRLAIDYPDANLVISSFDTDGETVWFTVKNGAVYEASAAGLNLLYYQQSENFADVSLPWRVAAGHNALYLADIGRREVLSVDGQGTVETVFALAEGHAEIEEFAYSPIYFALDASTQNLTATISNDILLVKSQSDQSILCSASQFSLAGDVAGLKWLARIAMFLLAGIVLAGIVLTAIFFIRSSAWSTGSRISVMIMAIIVITLAIVLPITYNSGMQLYVDNSLAQLSSVVQMGGYMIDAEALKSIKSPGDYMNDDYRRLLRSMEELIDKQYEWNDRLYCMLYAFEDGILYTPAFLDGTGGAFYPYDFGIEDSSLEAVFSDGEIVSTEVALDSSGSWMYVQGPIFDKEGHIVGAVEVGLDIYSYYTYYRSLYITIILAVISAGVILQMIIMQILKMADFIEKRKALLQSQAKLLYEPVEFIGPTVFLLFFAFNLTTSFLPIYVAKLYVPIPGWPREFMEALPLSANLLAIVLGSALAGNNIRIRGVNNTLRLGTLITILPYCLLGFVQDYAIFLLLFSLAGLGFGIVQNAVNTYIANIPDAAEQSMGFSYFNSALFIGFNCGTVVGAVLAQALGQNMVFTATGILFIPPTILLLKLIRAETSGTETAVAKAYINRLSAFLTNPAILLLFILALIPYAVSGHFMFFFMPLYSESLGLTETAISQLFLVNGLCILAFSSFLTRVTSRYLRSYHAIALSLLIVAAAFAYFALSPSLQTVIIVLVLLGISSAFGASALRAYYTQQPNVKRYGYDRAMSIFATVENGGDTLGPIVFSFVLMGSIQKNFLVMAIAITAFTAIFVLSAKVLTKKNMYSENAGNIDEERKEVSA